MISGKPISQHASYKLIFNLLYSIINREQYESISTINPAIVEIQNNRSLKNAPHLLILKWVCHLITLYRYVSFRFQLFKHFGSIPSNNKKTNVRSTPASTALTLVSHQSHNVCNANRHPCGSGERSGAQRRTKVSVGRTMTSNSAKIKPVSLTSYRVTLV